MSRICLVCVSLRAGGTERIVSRIANHLARQHKITVLLLSNTIPFYTLSPDVSLIYPDLGPKSQEGWRWYPQILRHLWRGLSVAQPDLVLCFGESIAPFVTTVARLCGKSVIIFNRASPITSLHGLRGLLNPLTYPLAHRVVVQTTQCIEVLRRRYRLSRFEVLSNPIDIPKRISPVDQRQHRILTVGTLGGEKNQEALIRAFFSLESRNGWTLEFVGDGPDRWMLENLRDDLELLNSVTFWGQRKDVDELLQDSAIFAFTSLTEGFPNALAEAMAAGCACISYDCPTGPSELIDHGVSGFLVRPGDEPEYARLLQRLVEEPHLRSEFSFNARESIKRFKASIVLRKLSAMIETQRSAARQQS